MEKYVPSYHEDHIAGKGGQFFTTLQFGTQIYSCASIHVDSRSQAAVDKEWERLEKSGVGLDESQNESDVFDEENEGFNSRSSSLMDVCYLKNAELEM